MYRYLFLLLSFLLPTQAVHSQKIAITFDDAPTLDGPLYSGTERSLKILNALQKNNIDQVAFFVLTGNITPENKQRLEQYAAAGHVLANHTHSHNWIHNRGTKAYIEDIKKADEILKPMKGFTPWFRYPFLDEGKTISVRDSIRDGLKHLNLVNGYVTVDNYEWYLNDLVRKGVNLKRKINFEKLKEIYINHLWQSIVFYDEVAKQTIGRSPNHVLLLHENDLAALFLDDLIKHIKSNGWTIVSPKEAYEDPIAQEIPDVLFNGQGRVAAIAKSKGMKGRDLVQMSEDEEYLDRLVEEQKIFE